MKKIFVVLFVLILISSLNSQSLITTFPLEHNLEMVLSAKAYNLSQLINFYKESKKAWGKYGEIAILKKLVKDGNIEAIKALKGVADVSARDIYDEDIFIWAFKNANQELLDFLGFDKIDIYKKNIYGLSFIDYLLFSRGIDYFLKRRIIDNFNYRFYATMFEKINKNEKSEFDILSQKFIDDIKKNNISDKDLLVNLEFMNSRSRTIGGDNEILSNLLTLGLIEKFYKNYPETSDAIMKFPSYYLPYIIKEISDTKIKKKYLEKALKSPIDLDRPYQTDTGLLEINNEIYQSLDEISKKELKPLLERRKHVTATIASIYTKIWDRYNNKTVDFNNEIDFLRTVHDYEITGPFYSIDFLHSCQNYELTAELLRLGFPCYGITSDMFPDLINPLSEAILVNRFDLVSLYVKEFMNNNVARDFLTIGAYQAVLVGHTEILRRILAGGADFSFTGRLVQARANEASYYTDKLSYPFPFLVFYEGYMGDGTQLFNIEFKNETLINLALKNNKTDILNVLMDHGINPYDIYTNNKLEYIEQPAVSLDPKYPDRKTKIYRINITSHFQGDAFEQAKFLGLGNVEKSMRNYLTGLVMPDYMVNALQVLIEKEDYKQIEDLVSVIKIGEQRYCPRDRKLLRRVYFYLGNYYFRAKKYAQAIGWYKKGVAKAESNINEITDYTELLGQKLEGWIEEGEAMGGAAFQVYNIACSLSLQGDQVSALSWLKIAIRLDPKTKEYALSDADLSALRQKYGTAF